MFCASRLNSVHALSSKKEVCSSFNLARVALIFLFTLTQIPAQSNYSAQVAASFFLAFLKRESVCFGPKGFRSTDTDRHRISVSVSDDVNGEMNMEISQRVGVICLHQDKEKNNAAHIIAV